MNNAHLGRAPASITNSGSVAIAAHGLPDAMYHLANILVGNGDPAAIHNTRRRGMDVTEIRGAVLLEIENPQFNLPIISGRNANPWVTLAEFPWIIAGRNDIKWLERYLPRAKDFSDDGKTWRAGYGPRMRNLIGVDQLKGVVEALSQDPSSRQAVMSIWVPELDLGEKSKDIPCTNWLHFQITEGKLNLTVVMRSNDFVWGFSGVNVYNFTTLQTLVANLLDVKLGVYRHVADNMHVYSGYMKTALNVAAARRNFYATKGVVIPNLCEGDSLERFTSHCVTLLDVIGDMRNQRDMPSPAEWFENLGMMGASRRLVEWGWLMLFHSHYDPYDRDLLLEALLHITSDDYAAFVMDYAIRDRLRRGVTSSSTVDYDVQVFNLDRGIELLRVSDYDYIAAELEEKAPEQEV